MTKRLRNAVAGLASSLVLLGASACDNHATAWAQQPAAAPAAAAGAQAADRRLPQPGAAAVKRALAAVKDIFGDDYARATTTQAKVTLAKRFLGEAEKTAAPEEQWALASEAIRLASEAGDFEATFNGIAWASTRFAIDATDLKLDALTKLSTKATPQSADTLAQAAIKLAEESADVGNAVVAGKALGVASGLARKSSNRAISAEVTRIQREIREQDAASKEVAAINAKLAADPADPDVCLEAGKLFCFKVDDWERGLPLLAKCSDVELARLSIAEASAGKDPASVIALADMWWEWADGERGPAKSAGQRHAASLYGTVLSKVQGLDRAKLEKRVATASAEGPVRGKKTFLADIKPASENAIAFGVHRDGTFMGAPFSCGGKQWPKGITQMPGGDRPATISFVLPENSKRLRGKAGVFLPQGANAASGPREPLEFEIVVDGRSAWKSPPLPKPNDSVDFDVPLFGAKQLELRTNCKSGHSAWAAWLDPEILQ